MIYNLDVNHYLINTVLGVTMTILWLSFARMVAYPVQVAYWILRSWPPRIQCPMSILTSGPETWPWGPVGWRRSSHDRVSRVPACESSPRAKLESETTDGAWYFDYRHSWMALTPRCLCVQGLVVQSSPKLGYRGVAKPFRATASSLARAGSLGLDNHT